MAVNSFDPITGAPRFVDSDAPDIKVDPNEAAKYAADVGNYIVRDNLTALDAYAYKRKGLRGFARDTGYEYLHDGTAWTTASAFVLLGAKTLTAANTADFDGVFSSRFANYLVRVNVRSLSSAGSIAFQMRAGGSNAAGASDYVAVSRSNSGGSVTGASVASSSGPLTKATVAALYAEVSLFDPAVAARTVALVSSHGVGSSSAGENGDISVQHNPAVVYDGFRLLTSGPTMTGTVTVFGIG
jgi:hypothetical protein